MLLTVPLAGLSYRYKFFMAEESVTFTVFTTSCYGWMTDAYWEKKNPHKKTNSNMLATGTPIIYCYYKLLSYFLQYITIFSISRYHIGIKEMKMEFYSNSNDVAIYLQAVIN